MNDTTDTPQNPDAESGSARTLGDWTRIIDRLMVRELAAALAENDSDLREWMALRMLSGDVPAPHFAHRLAHAGRHLHPYAERGWIAETADGWTLTDEGRAAKDRLDAIVAEARERATDGIPAEDLATTTATLEAVARRLRWDGRMPDSGPRFGFGPGFGPGFGRGRSGGPGFAPGFGPGHRPGRDVGAGRDFGPGHHGECGRGDRGHHHEERRGHRGHERAKRERAYERGFEAGFTAAGKSAAR